MQEASTTPKFKVKVNIRLKGPQGNAFAIMGIVAEALRKAGATKEQIEEYGNESRSGDYENLLSTAHKWVDIKFS